MWSRRALLTGIAGIGAVGALNGCGFRPLYGRSGGGDLSEALARVEIGPIPDRVGQLVRNALLDGLRPRGASSYPAFRLDVDVQESISSLAVRKSANATRADLNLSGTFILRDFSTGTELLSGTSQAISSYNILNSEFTTLMSEKGARDRAARQLADDIRLKIATFLKTNSAKG